MGKKKNHRLPQPKGAKAAHKKSSRTPGGLRKPPPLQNKKKTTSTSTNTNKQPQRSQEPIVPYKPADRILLVGEGDFSFSVSLLTTHLLPGSGGGGGGGENVDVDVDAKVPDADADAGGEDLDLDEDLGEYTHPVPINLTATSYDTESTLLEKYPQSAGHIQLLRSKGTTVLHGVDVTKFSKLPKSLRRRAGAFDIVGFMFPHVGGLSTDVGRQVKSNQELLLGFFTTAAELLARGGTAVVTLFDGAPYDQWDIKALAKAAGFTTRRSFRFISELYPGYKHSRTLGNVEGSGNAWKGEERNARTYVSELVDGKGYSGEKTGANAIEVRRIKKTTKRERRFQDESSDEEDVKKK